jgi:hypothetical protein
LGLVALALSGLGSLAARLALGPSTWCDICGPVEAFWLGLPVAIAIVQVIHFVAPVSTLAQVVVCCGGAVGWLLRAPRLSRIQWDRTHLDPLVPIALAVCLVGVVSVCNRLPASDTGLYYEQTVLWTQARKITPGLANLHERLAFNGSSFLLESLFAPLLPVGRRYGAIVGAAYWLCAFMAVRSLAAVARGHASGSRVLLAWSVPFLLYQKRLSHSGNPDMLLWAVQLAAVYYLLRATEEDSRDSKALHVILSCLLLVSAVTIKLSGLVFSACILAIAWWLWRRHGASQREASVEATPRLGFSRVGAAGLGLALLVGGGWVARNVLLSGELLFPVPMTTVPVRWALPMDVALAGQFRDIRAWARAPGPDFIAQASGGHWFGDWARRTFGDPQLTASILLLVVAAAVVAFVLKADRSRQLLGFLWVSAVMAGFFVFLTAPDFRFAGAALVVGQAPLAIVLWGKTATRRTLRSVTLLASCALSGYLLLHGCRDAGVALVSGARRPEYASPSVDQVRLAAGLVVNVPSGSDRCWNAGLPCTPGVNPRLRAAGPTQSVGTIEYFYMTAGADRPEAR